MTFIQRIRDDGENYAPIGRFVDFKIDDIARGRLTGSGKPNAGHYNPFGIVHGGFASTLLDLALGHVSITMLDDMANAITTTDLSVKYMRPISSDTGELRWEATVPHAGKTMVIAEARLFDSAGKLYATSQSTCLIVRRRTS